METGNEWVRDDRDGTQAYVRVWHGPTCVAHYRADAGTARLYVDEMRQHLVGLRYTIDPLPSFAPPTRPLPVWHLGHTAP